MDELDLRACSERIVGDVVIHFANPVFDREALDRIRSAGHAAAQRVYGCAPPDSVDVFERAAVPAVRMAVMDAARDELDRYLVAAQHATTVRLHPSSSPEPPADPVKVIDLRPGQLDKLRPSTRRVLSDPDEKWIAAAFGIGTPPTPSTFRLPDPDEPSEPK